MTEQPIKSPCLPRAFQYGSAFTIAFSLSTPERFPRSPRILFLISHILFYAFHAFYTILVVILLIPGSAYSTHIHSSRRACAYLISFHTYSSARFPSTTAHFPFSTPSQFALPAKHSSFIFPFSQPPHLPRVTAFSFPHTHVLLHFFPPSHFHSPPKSNIYTTPTALGSELFEGRHPSES